MRALILAPAGGGQLANHDIIAIGASAGGLDAFRKLSAGLPPDLPASILFVLHMKSDFHSILPEILSRSGPLPATFAEDGERPARGHIYVAPPDRHLLFNGKRLRLDVSAPENNARPAIDPLFRSAAICCGSRTIGVVLTGNLGDGSAGLHAIKRCGGIAVVQRPNDAAYPDMPRNAMTRAKADHVVTLADMPELLKRLVDEPAGAACPVPEDIRLEHGLSAG
jgi:two-component system chemotaxis response regulator CheB